MSSGIENKVISDMVEQIDNLFILKRKQYEEITRLQTKVDELEKSYKVCTECGHDNSPVEAPYLGCCPDSRYRTAAELLKELERVKHDNHVCAKVLEQLAKERDTLQESEAALKVRVERFLYVLGEPEQWNEIQWTDIRLAIEQANKPDLTAHNQKIERETREQDAAVCLNTTYGDHLDCYDAIHSLPSAYEGEL